MRTVTRGGDVSVTNREPTGHATARPPDNDAELFRRLYPDLRRFAAACAPASIEPDDLVQQAVANTLSQCALVELENPGAYLRTAILNLAKNQYRSDSRVQRLSPDAATTDTYPSDLAMLSELAPRDRAALYLVEIERLPYREAAALVGCSTIALRARVSRARKRLMNATQNGV